VYLTLRGGSKPDRLVAAATPRAAMTQIHVVTAEDGVSRMRETSGVDVPADAIVKLAPQATHLMLMGLTQPLVAGERFALTLEFAQAGPRAIEVEVRAPGDSPATLH
jgi:periplasmic copper chaperone A